MTSVGNIFQQTNPYEKFVQQLVELESRTINELKQTKSGHLDRKLALGQVSSAISGFTTKIFELQNPDNKAFQSTRFASSNPDVVSVQAAEGIDQNTSYNIMVNRLATNDIALTEKIARESTSLAELHSDPETSEGSVTLTIGDLTADITIDTVVRDGEGNPVLDEHDNPVLKSNEEIYNEIAAQINAEFGEAARATVFHVSSDEIQLSMQSLQTGTEQRIQFDNESASGVLADIVPQITHVVPQEELDASFTIDGVAFSRSGNVVDDAVQGLTFELHRTSDIPTQLTIGLDVEKARSNIDEFIETYNRMNETIRGHTYLNSDTGMRGTLQSMRSIRNLTMTLRQTALVGLENVEEGQISRLSDIGIDFEKDGKMVVRDSDLLNQMLEQRSDEVNNLFYDQNSSVSQMLDQARSFTRARTGMIPAFDKSIDDQIRMVDRRITAQERHLERYEQQQREMFARLDLAITEGQDQFNRVLMFQQSMGMF